MKNFYLSKKFDFIFSVHDTMNYFLSLRDLRRVFKSVRAVMNAQSIFMFDITTEHNIKRYFDGKVMKYYFRSTAIEWSNHYDKKKKIITSTLVFQPKNGAATMEKHVQRIYTSSEIRRLLRDAGFRVMDIFGDYTFSSPGRDTIMINFVTRRL